MWSKWTSWSECSKTCFHHVNDVGFRHRFRSCNSTLATINNGTSPCIGDSEVQEPCNIVQCPGNTIIHLHSSATPQLGWNKEKTDILYLLSVNGGWSTWPQWSKCSAKCDSGVQIRERFCNSPLPLHGGSKCLGPHIQTTDCNSHPCSGTPGTTSTVTNNYKYSNNINIRDVFKSICLHPQVHVHRGWCTWQQLNVRHRVVHVHGCVWTWLALRCSAPPPAMMAATAPKGSTCSTKVVCLCLSVHATTRGRCMMPIQPCQMMPAITGNYQPTVNKLYEIYLLNWIFVSTKAHVLMVIWSVDHLPVLVSNRHSSLIFKKIVSVYYMLCLSLDFADSCFHLVCMVYSGLWLEQLDPMECMQSNMWCWREAALSLRNQPSCRIWGSTLQRGQSWDWYMQHWTLLWSVYDWHPPRSFSLLWHLESLKADCVAINLELIYLWSIWRYKGAMDPLVRLFGDLWRRLQIPNSRIRPRSWHCTAIQCL